MDESSNCTSVCSTNCSTNSSICSVQSCHDVNATRQIFDIEDLNDTLHDDDIQEESTRNSGRYNPCASFLMLETLSDICNEEINQKKVVSILTSFILQGEDDGGDDGYKEKDDYKNNTSENEF